ncbi:2-hydroxyacid dehydrogenase [Massilia niastensis]|uniref:2-hydroxyacid dehydrogenase n=1 Tax=Massilia niastensis TaxID=544911 RepID=UPI00036F7256|nr:2-hydroxyacid dehydrogenase [Massilia niastensis]
MHDLLQIGTFPTQAQALIDQEFRCHTLEQLEADGALRARVRAIVTRGNYAVPRSVIERLPRLGAIASMGVGIDLIDLAAAREHGVLVANTPDVLNDAVAELCIGLLFALLRRLPEADRFVRAGGWQQGVFPLTTTLAGKRVGIVGLGRIGKDIARRLEPFGVSIAYHGRSDQHLHWTYQPDLRELARDADVLILIAPGGEGTRRLVDASVLDALGPRGFLVNVARGSVVDEAALLAALEGRRIAGAALDVFENEPGIDERFLALDNVVLTPHVGSATVETRSAMARLTVDNLRRFFEDGTVLTPVPAAVRTQGRAAGPAAA